MSEPEYKSAVCRGSFALGTACGRCERCQWRLDNHLKADPDPQQTEAPERVVLGYDSSWPDVKGLRVVYPGEDFDSEEYQIEYIRFDLYESLQQQVAELTDERDAAASMLKAFVGACVCTFNKEAKEGETRLLKECKYHGDIRENRDSLQAQLEQVTAERDDALAYVDREKKATARQYDELNGKKVEVINLKAELSALRAENEARKKGIGMMRPKIRHAGIWEDPTPPTPNYDCGRIGCPGHASKYLTCSRLEEA